MMAAVISKSLVAGLHTFMAIALATPTHRDDASKIASLNSRPATDKRDTRPPKGFELMILFVPLKTEDNIHYNLAIVEDKYVRSISVDKSEEIDLEASNLVFKRRDIYCASSKLGGSTKFFWDAFIHRNIRDFTLDLSVDIVHFYQEETPFAIYARNNMIHLGEMKVKGPSSFKIGKGKSTIFANAADYKRVIDSVLGSMQGD